MPSQAGPPSGTPPDSAHQELASLVPQPPTRCTGERSSTMPVDLTPHLDPASTAVVALEVQENLLLPEKAMIPGLAAHAHAIGLIDRLATLFQSARRIGVPILYV